MLSKIPASNEGKAKKNDFPWKVLSNCEMETVKGCKFKHKSMTVNLEIKCQLWTLDKFQIIYLKVKLDFLLKVIFYL